MKKRTSFLIINLILLSLILSACNFSMTSRVETEEWVQESETSETQAETGTSSVTSTPTPKSAAQGAPEETETPAGDSASDDEEVDSAQSPASPEPPVTVGPEDFPEGINPLTGLPAADPTTLDLPAALLSVSNFPASARPQAGLNSSPIVFELYIGEGMTRFLALFYGQFPSFVSGQTEGQTASSQTDGTGETSSTSPSDGSTSEGDVSDSSAGDDAKITSEDISIGPIRSGRLPYEDIRSIYSGFLVMASAYSGVAQNLNQATTIYGSDSDDINSAMIGVDRLYDIALSHAEGYPGSNFNMEGMMFSTTPPKGGRNADRIWVFYSNLNQIQWLYDEDLDAYIRYDIKTDGSGEFVMATDRLTGEPLSRENVIVIFATHDFIAPTLIDVLLTNMPLMPALLFRDGELHEIFWTTQFGEYEQETGLLRPMRFVDAAGNPVALKPGQSWIEIVTTYSTYAESAISDYPFYPIIEEEGTGLWLVRFRGMY